MKIGAMKVGKNYQVEDVAFGPDPAVMQLYKEPEVDSTYAITVFTKPSVTVTGASIEETCKLFSERYPKCIIRTADDYNRLCIKKQIESALSFAEENDLLLSFKDIVDKVLEENENKV